MPFLRVIAYATTAFTLVILVNVLKQLVPRRKHEPPVVFHWFPFIGNAINYGVDPYKFLVSCREKV